MICTGGERFRRGLSNRGEEERCDREEVERECLSCCH